MGDLQISRKDRMLAYLLQGIVLGFTAGISPGPMLGLVINQTLKHGWRAGSVTALAPLLSDTPIIILMVFVLGHLPQLMLHVLSQLRVSFVVYLDMETIRIITSHIATTHCSLPS